jgi:hypothetical protein
LVRVSGGGVAQGNSQQSDFGSQGGNPWASCTPYAVVTLGAGTYEAVMQQKTGGGTQNATSAFIADTQVDVFQLGA